MAGLPKHITLESCRYGEMTELGDAGLTEQQIMSLSGHVTPAAARVYVKRTKHQRLLGARMRRAAMKGNGMTTGVGVFALRRVGTVREGTAKSLKVWLGRQDSNLGMAESKSAALPLGYAPMRTRF